MSKAVQVTTNDPSNGQFNLSIKGYVKKFADIQPEYVRFSGRLNTKIEKTVKITPDPGFPFKIKSFKPGRKEYIRASLRSVSNGYELTVTNIYSKEGSYNDVVRLVTNNPQIPEIIIRVVGFILAPETGDKP